MDKQNIQPNQQETKDTSGVSQNSVHPQSLLYLLAAFLTGVLLTGVVSYHLLAQSAVQEKPIPGVEESETPPQQPQGVFEKERESTTFDISEDARDTTMVVTNLLDTTNWKNVNYQNISFKIPVDAELVDANPDDNLVIVSHETPFYKPYTDVYIHVYENYDGTSRRMWYLNHAIKDPNNTRGLDFREIKIGNLRALDVIQFNMYNNVPQYHALVLAGPTQLLALTSIEVFYDKNNDSVVRYPLLDTIASTIEFK